MHLFISCGALVSLDKADWYIALVRRLQSSMWAAIAYRLSTSFWKSENVGVDGVERDWSGMVDSDSKRFRFSVSTLLNVETEPCGLADR